jgi:ABC-type glycerol-3-phosphate transport system substrate-binding protein
VQNPEIEVLLRVKAASGPGGLLESLSTASAAAPDALPSLVALTRSDLETAALKGLVIPMDDLTAAFGDKDWYEYARQMGDVQGSLMGLPFSGDTQVLVYRSGRPQTSSITWQSFLQSGNAILFPAASRQAYFPLALYMSIDGRLRDEEFRPALELDKLTQMLQFFSDGSRQGVFPSFLSNYDSDAQVWQAYEEQRANWMVTWGSSYLSRLPADSQALALPGLTEGRFTLADGWIWALVEPRTDQQAMAVKLAEYLVNADFLREWTSKTGFFPVRPSSLEDRVDQTQVTLISQSLNTAKILPEMNILTTITPLLQEATLNIIQGQGNPGQTAESVVERLERP